jgi:hypothetical protein
VDLKTVRAFQKVEIRQIVGKLVSEAFHDFRRKKEFGEMRAKSTTVLSKKDFRCAWVVGIMTAIFTAFSGCVTYQPVPASVPSPNTFDRAWNAAVGAAQDEGVRITSEDRARGVITGTRGEQSVTVNVQTQADGNVRVEFSARGPKGADPGLASRISRAYDRRMGR